MGTFGSRSLAVGGIALGWPAARCGKAKVIAANMLEVSPEELEFNAGRCSVRRGPDQGKTIQEIAFATFTAHNLPDGVEPSLDSDATYDPDNFSFPHGTHLCAVEVDTETGTVKIRSYVAVDDVGKVVNPMIVEGQVHGGIAQGIAQALYEEAAYDSSGDLVTPRWRTTWSRRRPTSRLHHRPDDLAVHDQPTRRQGRRRGRDDRVHPGRCQRHRRRAAPIGVADIPMPCTPERVWRAIQEAGSANAEGTVR